MANAIHSLSLKLSLLGKFWQEKVNHTILRWNVLLILSSIGFLVIKFGDLPPQVPLYFSLPWGENQLAPASSLFFMPTFSIVIAILNNLLAAIMVNSQVLFARLLVIFSLIFSIFTAISVFNIVALVA